ADATLVGEAADAAKSWVVGAEGSEPDALLIVAGDAADDVQHVVDQQLSALRSLDPTGSGVRIHIEWGQTRTAQRSHEHFGFKDGISQPGIRGRVNRADGRFVTLRQLDASDPLSIRFAAPGQELCWPGEFVLGYPRKREGGLDPNETQSDPTTSLTRNG